MSEKTKKTIIDEGTELEGSIHSPCDVSVSGSVKGELVAPVLTVTKAGSIDGRIMVEQLNCAGRVRGEIEADAVELSGQVSDESVIRAGAIEVMFDQPEDRPVTFGNCKLEIGDAVQRSSGKKQERQQQGQERKSEQKEPVGAKVPIPR